MEVGKQEPLRNRERAGIGPLSAPCLEDNDHDLGAVSDPEPPIEYRCRAILVGRLEGDAPETPT